MICSKFPFIGLENASQKCIFFHFSLFFFFSDQFSECQCWDWVSQEVMILKNVIFFFFLPLLCLFKDGYKRKPTTLLNWVQYLSEPSLKIQFPFTSEREKTKPAPTFFKYLANQISCLAAMILLTRLPPLSLLTVP